MVQLDMLDFDAASVEPNDGFSPIPAGDYTAIITASEWKDTKRGDGRYLTMTFEIVDDKANGRRIWENLNLDNPNPKAVDIAKQRLSAICRAVGIMNPSDTEELHDKMMLIRVDIKSDDYGEKNIIKSIKPYGQQFADSVPEPKAEAKPKTATPKAKKPWE